MRPLVPRAARAVQSAPCPSPGLTRNSSAVPDELRFYLGDSVQVLGTLPEASADVVVTSPPYNLGIRYRSYDDGRPRVGVFGVDRAMDRRDCPGADGRTGRCS